MERLQKYIDFLPMEAILPHWDAAANALRGVAVDPEDVSYVATALSVPSDGIGSVIPT